MPFPFAGPPPDWCPPGSTLLGLLNGLIGAAAGMLVGRGIKWGFEFGFGQEALGLGDADLLMCIGAFLGWQVAVLALPVGAFVTAAAHPFDSLFYLGGKSGRSRVFVPDLPVRSGDRRRSRLHLDFLALDRRTRAIPGIRLDGASGLVVVIVGVGLLAAGMILKRRPKV